MRQRWESDQLVEFWTLEADELALVSNKSGAARLGFAVLLKFFSIEARFPQQGEIPAEIADFVARQVGVEYDEFGSYDWSGRSWKRHRGQIRSHFGFRAWSEQADTGRLIEGLVHGAASEGLRFDDLVKAAYGWCRQHRVEPPFEGPLHRLVRAADRRWELDAFAVIAGRMNNHLKTGVDDLVSMSSRDRLSALRSDPGPVGVKSIDAELAKLEVVDAIPVPLSLFEGFSGRVLDRWCDRFGSLPPSGLLAIETQTRRVLTAVWLYRRRAQIVDGIVDLLISVVHKILSKAERRVEREQLADLRRVKGKTNLLFRLAEAALANPEGTISEVLFPIVDPEDLADLVREYQTDGPALRSMANNYARSSYARHYRRSLLAVLERLSFDSSNTAHRPVSDAIKLICRYSSRPGGFFDRDEPVPVEGLVSPAWRHLVLIKDDTGTERVNRIGYEICVLGVLRDRLRCKEIWVEHSYRWRDPDQDLPADFDAQRASYYHAIDKPADPEEFISGIRDRLTGGLDRLNQFVADGGDGMVQISERRNGWIQLQPLKAQPEPANLGRLKDELNQRWPSTSLLDILKETELRLGICDQFETTATREALPTELLRRRLLLALFAVGTNAGIRRVSSSEPGTDTESDLHYIRRRYLTPANLRKAITTVVNATHAARHEHHWGHVTTTASDSTKFGAWDQNLLTEWHTRYRGPGVMIYWHVDRKSLCVYSQLKSCSSSEVAAMIEGLLRHQTDVEIEGNYVDTHGQSEVGFAFTELLGFKLLPRLKRIGAQRLYLPEPRSRDRWPALEPVLTRPINWKLIANQYDQMIRYATAIRLRTADTETILRRFTRSNVRHPTYRALCELGKATRTAFLCDYLTLIELRREIQEGLNVVEHWNSANGFIHYGKGGDITTNQRHDQELAALCLHLLQACLVYVNTLMIQRILDDADTPITLDDIDRRGLNPLIYRHVNPYGTFNLDLDTRLALT